MSRVIIPPPIKIAKDHADAFFLAVTKALLSLPVDDLQQVYLFHDKAIVISYSGNYEPFICFTMSYNDPDYRLYINQDTYVLTRIAEALDLQGRDIPGGRVFIESSYAYIKDLDFNHKVILLLDWQGSKPFEILNAMYNSILEKKSGMR